MAHQWLSRDSIGVRSRQPERRCSIQRCTDATSGGAGAGAGDLGEMPGRRHPVTDEPQPVASIHRRAVAPCGAWIIDGAGCVQTPALRCDSNLLRHAALHRSCPTIRHSNHVPTDADRHQRARPVTQRDLTDTTGRHRRTRGIRQSGGPPDSPSVQVPSPFDSTAPESRNDSISSSVQPHPASTSRVC